MTANKTPDDSLLDAQLDFIMNAPQEDFDEYFAESGADVTELQNKGVAAFNRAIETLASAKQAAEGLASLTPAQQGILTSTLRIRRSVLAALREHRVIVSSIPRRFMRQLADQLHQSMEALALALSTPAPQLVGQYKSDQKPSAPERITFERLLRDAAMSEEDIRDLLRDGD